MENLPHRPTIVLCKFCMQVIENGECKYCANKTGRLSQSVPTESPKPRDVISLVELGPVRTVKLTTSKSTLGRDNKNEIHIAEDPYVSRHHAAITFEDGKFWIEDLGSKNGTKVNGAEILDKEPINRGDIITIGSTNYIVE